MEDCIAVIGAMDEEIAALSEGLDRLPPKGSSGLDLPIFKGRLHGQTIVVVRCRVGKVHAALATQYVIDHFHPTIIINSGVAGGISPNVRIGDLVLGTSSVQHDFDVRYFGYTRGAIPGLESSIFTADPRLLGLTMQAAASELSSDRIHQGLIVSGDQFISSQEQKQEILNFFPDAMCAEMEGAAIAQVSSANKVPHLIMRSISDQADNTAPQDFDQFLLDVIPVLNRVIHRLFILLQD